MNDLPEEWRSAELGELIESAVDGPFGSNLKTEHYVDAPGVRVIRLQNLGVGDFIDDDHAFISEAHAAGLSRHKVRSGDLLIASLGDEAHPVARACQYPASGILAIVKADCFRIRLSARVADPGFVRNILNCASTREGIDGLSQGVTRDRVNLASLKHLRISLPPISEQHRIVEILDTADQAIRSTEQLIAKHEQAKQGLLHELLTRGIKEDGRFRDTDSHPEMFRTTRAGLIPVSWDVASVGDVGDVLLGRQRSPQHQKGRFMLPYLRVANVFDGFIDYSDVLSMNFTPREQEVYGLRSGDLLLNEGQSLELVGRCAIYEGRPGLHCFQNTLVRYRCSEAIIPRFAYLTFKYWLTLGRFMQIAKKTTSMAHLGASRFAAMPIAVPSLTEQQAIVAAFESFERRIMFERDQLAKHRLIKQGLMDDLLTGRVRVRARHE